MKNVFVKLFILCILTSGVLLNAQADEALNVKENAQTADRAVSEVNFETKKAEIIEVLGLNEKQQKKAETIYLNTKNEIGTVNEKIKAQYEEGKKAKASKENAEDRLKKIAKINAELDILYRARDKAHNEGMRKFNNILNKEQQKTWYSIKAQGGRLFPEIDTIEAPKKLSKEEIKAEKMKAKAAREAEKQAAIEAENAKATAEKEAGEQAKLRAKADKKARSVADKQAEIKAKADKEVQVLAEKQAKIKAKAEKEMQEVAQKAKAKADKKAAKEAGKQAPVPVEEKK